AAARAGRSKAAQRYTLGGGMRNKAGRAPEQAETGDGAEAIVELGARRLRDARAVEHGDVGRRLGLDLSGHGDGSLNRLGLLLLRRERKEQGRQDQADERPASRPARSDPARP